MPEHRCLTCESTDIDVYEFPDEPKAHIYCREDDCGWVHRSVDVATL